MKIAVGSDNSSTMTMMLLKELVDRGHEVFPKGPMVSGAPCRDWPLVAEEVARSVAEGESDEGIVCCWTGTGVTIAANKVRGIRAALCGDAETARSARIFNHANVLTLSMRATSIPVMQEILNAWFATPIDSGEAMSEWNQEQIRRIVELEGRR